MLFVNGAQDRAIALYGECLTAKARVDSAEPRSSGGMCTGTRPAQ